MRSQYSIIATQLHFKDQQCDGAFGLYTLHYGDSFTPCCFIAGNRLQHASHLTGKIVS